jgi:prepilin-type processing-associated H-X9-DG protein
MPISFTCPSCGQSSIAGDEFAGQTGPCRACGKPVTIPLGKPMYVAPPATSSSGGGTWGVIAIVLGVLGIGGVLCAGILAALMIPAFQSAKAAAQRMQSSNNLKQIALAFHNYESTYKRLPPAVQVDAEGKPSRSWRVTLLPYLEQSNLYQQYQMDQPWDSPANQVISNTSILTYKNPADLTAGPLETSYMVITGPGTLFDNDRGTSFAEVTDGLSNTILAVEVVGTGVKWTEPKDLDIKTMIFKINAGGANAIGSPFRGGANVAMGDGSVKFLSDKMLEATLRAMVTRNGGETVDVE